MVTMEVHLTFTKVPEGMVEFIEGEVLALRPDTISVDVTDDPEDLP